MLPDRKEAESFLRESEEIHPGPWADHCRTAAECAEKIARNCSGLDPEKAYIIGLLHDIGRRIEKNTFLSFPESPLLSHLFQRKEHTFHR